MVRLPPERALVVFACACCMHPACKRGTVDSSDSMGAREKALSSAPAFVDVAAESGVHFVHFNCATGQWRFPEIMGAGCALFDYDNDGDLDIYAVQGNWLVEGQPLLPPPKDAPLTNRLYRNDSELSAEFPPNRDATLRFTDVSEEAGVDDEGYGMGCAVGDIDNDGYPDLYVTNYGADVLFRNRGDGTFEDVSESSGVSEDGWSTSASFFDCDDDGDVDLYVAHYVEYSLDDSKDCRTGFDGRRDYCAPADYDAAPDRLFRNRGDGTFEDVSDSRGLSSLSGRGLGVVAADFNEDGRADIYVANDGDPNFLWINQGDGMFRDQALFVGVAVSAAGEPQASMGIALADFDRDLDFDICLSHLIDESHTFYRNLGRGLFEDATQSVGLAWPSLPFTGFGMVPIDFDNDGWEDLFVAHGAVFALESQRESRFPYAQEDHLYRNAQGVFEFVELPPASPLLKHAVGRGTAMGDIDNDGDLDLVVCNNSGSLRVLRNQVGPRGRSIMFQLVGTRSNRDAIGAEVRLRLRDGSSMLRRVGRDGSYLSANDIRVHFGLGDGAAVDSVDVRWPSGLMESWNVSTADQIHRLIEGTGHLLSGNLLETSSTAT